MKYKASKRKEKIIKMVLFKKWNYVERRDGRNLKESKGKFASLVTSDV